MIGTLEGLKPHDNVIVIKDQNENHSIDKTYHPAKGFVSSNPNGSISTIKAKDVPTMFQTQLEQENEALKTQQQAMADMMAQMQAAIKAQQEEMAAMRNMIENPKKKQ